MRRALALLLLAAVACAQTSPPERPTRRRRHRVSRTATVELGCEGTSMRPVPEDVGEAGPWPVGLRTVHSAGLTLDVYYPAQPGSERGVPPAGFDLRDFLPPAMAQKLAGAALDPVPCACARDLPLDDAHGPYPVVVFFHGRGLTRAEFPTLLAHLASRGFVVLSPDIPGVHLAAYVDGRGERRMEPIVAFCEGLGKPAGELAWLAGHLDRRVGLVGHSLGGGVVRDLLDRFGDVAIMMGAGGARGRRRRIPVMIMGGENDTFAPYALQAQGYEATAPPKRLVGVRGAGHMAFSDHCIAQRELGGWYGAAIAYELPLDGFLRTLAERGCADGELAAREAHRVILPAVTAELEETLMCSPGAALALADLADAPGVADLREQGVGAPTAGAEVDAGPAGDE